MDAKQFAWIYLIENGYAGCEPSYYGGWDLVDKSEKYKKLTLDWRGDWMKKVEKDYLDAIRTVGVDWNKTQAPRSDKVSRFTDTFHDPSYEEYLEGKIVLKDGSTQYWCAPALEISNVFEMMANIHQAAEKFGKIFGNGLPADLL